MFNKRSLLFLFLGVFLVAGCSDQGDPTQPGITGNSLSALIRGEMSRDLIDFEFAAKVGEGVDSDQGSLLVRGRNLAYDAELGALTVDISVYNDSDAAYPEPVGMTFIQFIPEDVTILNSDNDQSGPGALVLFEFDGEDGEWNPGEESMARNVQFQVASGSSIGFMARIDVGMSPSGGAIGGIVWMDENENGEIDPDEEGAGGVTIAVHTGDDVTVTPLTEVVTGDDGTYRFDGLDAGYYTVVRLPQDGLVGTTPSEMAVILVEMDGTVSDFLLANFGVTSGDDPGDDYVKVGDYVDAKGDYHAEPHRLVSEKFKVKRCDGDKHDRDDDDDDDGCRQNDCWGRLTGTVTGIDITEGYIEVMGTKVYCNDKDRGDDDDFECGIRVQVDVSRDEDEFEGNVIACRRPHVYKGKNDKVKGFVQEVIRGDDGYITGVIVLNTLVTVPHHDMNSETPVFTGSMRLSGSQGEPR